MKYNKKKKKKNLINSWVLYFIKNKIIKFWQSNLFFKKKTLLRKDNFMRIFTNIFIIVIET